MGVVLVFDLIGKRAVVTGTASGIGLAIGQLFASQGANIVLIDLDSERLNLGVAAITEKNRRAHFRLRL
jgi:7-alpha-hydroxysteroid dehydrogenase